MVFVPGKSGNPGGRPKTKHAREALLKAMREAEETGTAETWADIARAIRRKAAQGDLHAAQLLFDRVDGKLPTAVVGNDEEDAISVRTIVTGVTRAGDK